MFPQTDVLRELFFMGVEFLRKNIHLRGRIGFLRDCIRNLGEMTP